MATIPKDPLFSQQSYLQEILPYIDLKVVNVRKKYTGAGTVGVFEGRGVKYARGKLKNNYDTSIEFNAVSNNYQNTLSSSSGDKLHPNAVAGMIAGEVNNGIGGARVSPSVNVVSLANDPLFSQQWHLLNTGQLGGTPGMDLNVVKVWQEFTGAGVTVGVFEGGGVEYTHPDLINNYDTTIDYDVVGRDGDPFPSLEESHATSVAGIIAAEANNGIGGVGVAHGATLASFRFAYDNLVSPVGDFRYYKDVDVANNSWGFIFQFADNFYHDPQFRSAKNAILDGVKLGRNGLGTAIVFAGGNSREEWGNTNYHNFKNSIHVTAVGALTNKGKASSYSTPGASILVSAFGSGDPGSIVTTDRTGSNGYSSGDYTKTFNGTSAAVPQVSGVVALMLEANPNLGYRDIQEILAYSARQNDPTSTGWKFNGAGNWNGGGLHVSHDYGFGLVDALAAVRLAESWQEQNTYANRETINHTKTANLAIPDNNTTGITSSMAIAGGLEIDSVEVDLNISHTWSSDLEVTLISPSGTESVLITEPMVVSIGAIPDFNDSIVFRTSSTHYRGEDSGGTWKLRVRDLYGRYVGTLNSWKLIVTGDTDLVNNNTYVYTNEFANFTADAARTTLQDSSGIDTINAAAITSNINLDLNSLSNNTLAGNTLTIGATTVIENAFGGDGADRILGNVKNNTLKGGRGNDFLSGRDGRDELFGNAGDDTINGGQGNDRLNGNSGNDLLIGSSGADSFVFEGLNLGIDTISDFNNLTEADKIELSAGGFGGGLVAGVLNATQFAIASAATNGTQRIIYNVTNGAIFFDIDGNGAQQQVQFATVGNNLALTSNDFVVV